MTTENITFTGNADGLVGAANRGKRAIKEKGDEADKAGKKVKALDEDLKQTFTGMAKGVLITAAFTKSIEAAADAARRLREASAKASETKGGEAVRVEQALRGVGVNLTAEQRQEILGKVGEGTTSRSETLGFIESYAKQKGRRLTYKDLARATEAFTMGGYSQEELLSARRPPTLEEQRARYASYSQEARDELSLRYRANTMEAVNLNAVAPNQTARLVGLESQRQQLESPVFGAIPAGLSKLPGVGSGLEELNAAAIMQNMSRGPIDVRIVSDRTSKPIIGQKGAKE